MWLECQNIIHIPPLKEWKIESSDAVKFSCTMCKALKRLGAKGLLSSWLWIICKVGVKVVIECDPHGIEIICKIG